MHDSKGQIKGFKMGGRMLTKEEKAVIRAYAQDGLSIRVTAELVRRSRTTVSSLVGTCAGLHVCKKRGHRPKLSSRIKRRIFRAARTGRYSARQLRDKYDAAVTVRRIQQPLCQDAFLGYTRMQRAPNLTPLHKVNRVRWAR